MKIRVGSRDSLLAMTQTGIVINKIKNNFPNSEFEIIPIKTMGDKILDVSLDKIGGKGLFVNELESALMSNDIDMAVHSMKDMPIVIGDGLVMAAYSEREDARDVFISNKYSSLLDMPDGAVLGTSSLRRKLQALSINPKLEVKMLRGNVITRINKLEDGQYDAIILAMAGLNRLNLNGKAKYIFTTDEMVPAVCQGILGVETRENDEIIELLACIDDELSRKCVMAERAFMKTIGGSCSTPMGAYAEINKDIMTIKGFYLPYENSSNIKHTITGNVKDAEILGRKLGEMYE